MLLQAWDDSWYICSFCLITLNRKAHHPPPCARVHVLVCVRALLGSVCMCRVCVYWLLFIHGNAGVCPGSGAPSNDHISAAVHRLHVGVGWKSLKLNFLESWLFQDRFGPFLRVKISLEAGGVVCHGPRLHACMCVCVQRRVKREWAFSSLWFSGLGLDALSTCLSQRARPFHHRRNHPCDK